MLQDTRHITDVRYDKRNSLLIAAEVMMLLIQAQIIKPRAEYQGHAFTKSIFFVTKYRAKICILTMHLMKSTHEVAT